MRRTRLGKFILGFVLVIGAVVSPAVDWNTTHLFNPAWHQLPDSPRGAGRHPPARRRAARTDKTKFNVEVRTRDGLLSEAVSVSLD